MAPFIMLDNFIDGFFFHTVILINSKWNMKKVFYEMRKYDNFPIWED